MGKWTKWEGGIRSWTKWSMSNKDRKGQCGRGMEKLAKRSNARARKWTMWDGDGKMVNMDDSGVKWKKCSMLKKDGIMENMENVGSKNWQVLRKVKKSDQEF